MFVFVHVQVWSGFPREGENRGVRVLECLNALAPIIHEALDELFAKVIPKLTAFIEGFSYFAPVFFVLSAIQKRL